MTLEEMFERQREQERNTPEFLAEAERSYQEGKRRWIEHCRIKGIPHELETEPETLPQSEIAKFKEKTRQVALSIYEALVKRGNKKGKSPQKATSSRAPIENEVPIEEETEPREFQSASESEDNDKTLQKLELRSRKDPSENEEVESEGREEVWNTIL
jgi:hypothetical protein